MGGQGLCSVTADQNKIIANYHSSQNYRKTLILTHKSIFLISLLFHPGLFKFLAAPFLYIARVFWLRFHFFFRNTR